jgi:hypothetical protein
MVSLWCPVLCPRFNENVAAISLPAQTDLGNILEIATPLVSQTVQRAQAQVRQLNQTALSGWLGRNRLNSHVANLDREAVDWPRNGRTSSLGADPPCKASQERQTLERTMPSCHRSPTVRSSTPPQGGLQFNGSFRQFHPLVARAGIWHGDRLDCRGSRTNSDTG